MKNPLFLLTGSAFRKIASLIAISLAGSSFAQAQVQPVLYTPLHFFTNSPPDGNQPLSIALGADNVIYGVTFGGGTGSPAGGTIFRANRDGSGYAILHNFDATTTGNSNSIANTFPFSNSQVPTYGGLNMILGRDGVLYGITLMGGLNNQGTLFKLNRDGGGFTVLRSFGPADAGPATLIEGSDGALYGTTWIDGANGDGTIFRVGKDGNNYTVLHNFLPATDGFRVIEPLMQGKDGWLYGSVYLNTNGGQQGVIFKLNPNNQAFTVLRYLNAAADGFHPSRLLQGSDGYLYGTLYTGPGINKGALFQMDTNGTTFTELHVFATADGSQLHNGVIEGPGRSLYGAAYQGGTGGASLQGAIYKFNLGTSAFETIYNFDGGSVGPGAQPDAPLVLGSFSDAGGVLFGTTTLGGPVSGSSGFNGTLFSLVVNPPLYIAATTAGATNGATTVFWPAWAQNYVLQTATNLNSTNWTSVNTTGLQVIGVQITNGAPGAYYRLAYPTF